MLLLSLLCSYFSPELLVKGQETATMRFTVFVLSEKSRCLIDGRSLIYYGQSQIYLLLYSSACKSLENKWFAVKERG